MRLNHLDLHVPDIAAARDFFCQCLDFTEVEMRGANGLAILHDDAGLELVLSRPIEKFGGADTPTAGANTYHIGFIQPSRADVDALFARVKGFGAEVWNEPAEIRGGWLFYCFAPGGFWWRSAGDPWGEAQNNPPCAKRGEDLRGAIPIPRWRHSPVR